MKKVVCTCDRCSREITDVVYTLYCYAEDFQKMPFGGISAAVAEQNAKQNMIRQKETERHICRECKDQITDGVFIV